MKKALKHLAIGMLTLAMSFSLSVSAFAAEPVDTADMSSTEMSAEMESVTRAGNSWVGLLTSEVQIGSGTFLGKDISCYNHGSSPGAVQFRIAGRSPIGVVPGGGCQFQDVWGFKEIFAAPISGYGTYTLSWTD